MNSTLSQLLEKSHQRNLEMEEKLQNLRKDNLTLTEKLRGQISKK